MDWFGLAEILVIFASLYAIYRYSKPDSYKVAPQTEEDFKILMLQYIDKKLGPVQKTPHGLLKKDYLLHFQKMIVYFNTMAS